MTYGRIEASLTRWSDRSGFPNPCFDKAQSGHSRRKMPFPANGRKFLTYLPFAYRPSTTVPGKINVEAKPTDEDRWRLTICRLRSLCERVRRCPGSLSSAQRPRWTGDYIWRAGRHLDQTKENGVQTCSRVRHGFQPLICLASASVLTVFGLHLTCVVRSNEDKSPEGRLQSLLPAPLPTLAGEAVPGEVTSERSLYDAALKEAELNSDLAAHRPWPSKGDRKQAATRRGQVIRGTQPST
jgi:hypothetical protein